MDDHFFSPERPISSLAEDQLGRNDFATAIAKVIGQWTGRDSLVLAIYGPWGSGKSSLKNMVLDALSKRTCDTLTLEFNPWEWAGQEKVFEGFFRELSAKIGTVDASKAAERAAKEVKVYAAVLTAAASVAGSLRRFLVGFLLLLGLFGLAPSLTGNIAIRNTLAGVGILAFISAAGLAAAGNTADKFANYLVAKAESTAKSVLELKKELQGLLRGLDRNVLVVVDDVDRLTPEGIRLVFQLVKANADFPNLIYLLLLQRDTVEKALAMPDQADGANFVDKVVQVGFDIPKVSAKQLEDALDMAIASVVKDTPADRRFDRPRWNKLFHTSLLPYFRTFRDVKRFSNALRFHFELFRSGDNFDANPVDLIALEVLRQFEGSLYTNLHAARKLLTVTEGFDLEPYSGKKEALESLLGGARRSENARSIVENVFPPAAWTLAGAQGVSSSFRKEWLRELRPCLPEIFERYFRFSMSNEDLSESEVESLLSATAEKSSFVGAMTELSKKGLLPSAISALWAHSASIPAQNIVALIAGLMDMEVALRRQTTGTGTPLHIRTIWLMESELRKRNAEERAALLRDAIAQTTGLFLPLLSFVSSKEEREKETDPLVLDADVESLKDACITNIRAAAAESRLLTHPDLRRILHFWSMWGAVDEAASWFKGNSDSDSGLLTLLSAFLESMNEVDGERTIDTRYRLGLEEFGRYLQPDVVVERIRSLALSLRGQDQMLCRLFVREFDLWKNSGVTPSPRNMDAWIKLEDL
jgi:predicted KAP-like P-loop ATPase